MNYNFDIEDAQKYGVNEAIMLNNFKFWLRKNHADQVNIHDGRVWTYNTKKAYTLLFPFWSEFQIKRILQSLIDQDVLMTGNYNKAGYDRTLWYAAVHSDTLEIDIRRNRPMDKTESSNATDGIVRPIPDRKLQIKNSVKKESNTNGFDIFWKQYPNKRSKPQAEKAWNRLNAKDKERATSKLTQFIANLPDFQRTNFNLHAATYLNNKRWTEAVETSALPQEPARRSI